MINAATQDPDYWPPARSAAEEIMFVGSLPSISSGVGISRRVLEEKQRRLQRLEDDASGVETDHGFVIELSLSPSAKRPRNILQSQNSLHFSAGPDSSDRDKHDSLLQVRNTDATQVAASYDQSEFETLERLFPLFLRLLLEGRFSHLAGDLGIFSKLMTQSPSKVLRYSPQVDEPGISNDRTG
jgi:hypothetical protein